MFLIFVILIKVEDIDYFLLILCDNIQNDNNT
jgi:hypothetical protein